MKYLQKCLTQSYDLSYKDYNDTLDNRLRDSFDDQAEYKLVRKIVYFNLRRPLYNKLQDNFYRKMF